MRYVFLLYIILVYSGILVAEWKITGVVHGADGNPPKVGHVHVSSLGNDEHAAFSSSIVNPDGSYHLKFSQPGWFTLWFTAPFHQSTAVIVQLTDSSPTLHLNITLPTYTSITSYKEVKIIGDWQKFSFSGGEKMKREANGTFSYTRKATADTLSYQLLNISPPRSTNGTQQDYFVYDGGGDYRSVLRTTPGEEVTIIFDPQKLFRGNNEGLPRYQFDKNHEYLIEINLLNNRYTQVREAYIDSLIKYRQTHEDMSDFHFDFSDIIGFLDKSIAGSEGAIKRMAALLRLEVEMMHRHPDRSVLQNSWSILSPADPLWEKNPFQLGILAQKLYPNKEDSVLHEFIEKNPSRRVQAYALEGLLYILREKPERHDEYLKLYDQLKSEYGDLEEMSYGLGDLDPNKRIQVGKPVPDFEVKLIDTGESISNKTLLGKYYLIDFWATWCFPCVQEIPYLHKAYEQFKNKNFEIISFSLDRKLESVVQFRQKKWKMPWLNAHLEGGFNHPVAKAFEVKGIPKPIFVAPDGIIIATESELRRTRLLKTLTRVLTNHNRETSQPE